MVILCLLLYHKGKWASHVESVDIQNGAFCMCMDLMVETRFVFV